MHLVHQIMKPNWIQKKDGTEYWVHVWHFRWYIYSLSVGTSLQYHIILPNYTIPWISTCMRSRVRNQIVWSKRASYLTVSFTCAYAWKIYNPSYHTVHWQQVYHRHWQRLVYQSSERGNWHTLTALFVMQFESYWYSWNTAVAIWKFPICWQTVDPRGSNTSLPHDGNWCVLNLVWFRSRGSTSVLRPS